MTWLWLIPLVLLVLLVVYAGRVQRRRTGRGPSAEEGHRTDGAQGMSGWGI